MDERDTLVIDDNGSFYKLNGGLYKKTSGMLDMLEESNVKDNPDKMTLALKNAYKCNKSKWMRDSIMGTLAIVFGGVAATIAGLMVNSPLVLLAVNLGVITLTVGDQIFRVDNADRKNVSRIRDICDKYGISYTEVSNTKVKAKAKDHLVEKEVSMDTVTPSASPLSSLGKTFSSATKHVETPSSEPVKLTVPRLDAHRAEATSDAIDTVKSTNDNNVKNILAGLREAHEKNATVTPVSSEISTEEPADSVSLDTTDIDDTRSAE